MLNLHSSFRVRNQLSHSYKIRNKITVLYILIFRFVDRRWEYTEGIQKVMAICM